MAIPAHRRDLLKILPADLVEALRRPLAHESRRALVSAVVSDQIIRIQALRHVEELHLAGGDDDRPNDAADHPGPRA